MIRGERGATRIVRFDHWNETGLSLASLYLVEWLGFQLSWEHTMGWCPVFNVCKYLIWSYVPCRGTITNVLRLLFDLSVKLATKFWSASCLHVRSVHQRCSAVYLERNSIKQIFGLADSRFDRTWWGRNVMAGTAAAAPLHHHFNPSKKFQITYLRFASVGAAMRLPLWY